MDYASEKQTNFLNLLKQVDESLGPSVPSSKPDKQSARMSEQRSTISLSTSAATKATSFIPSKNEGKVMEKTGGEIQALSQHHNNATNVFIPVSSTTQEQTDKSNGEAARTPHQVFFEARIPPATTTHPSVFPGYNEGDDVEADQARFNAFMAMYRTPNCPSFPVLSPTQEHRGRLDNSAPSATKESDASAHQLEQQSVASPLTLVSPEHLETRMESEVSDVRKNEAPTTTHTKLRPRKLYGKFQTRKTSASSQAGKGVRKSAFRRATWTVDHFRNPRIVDGEVCVDAVWSPTTITLKSIYGPDAVTECRDLISRGFAQGEKVWEEQLQGYGHHWE